MAGLIGTSLRYGPKGLNALYPYRLSLNSDTNMEEPDFSDDYSEDTGYDDCPKCGRHYDQIDYEYQSCSKCGWDAEKKKWGEAIEPTEEDFMNGDADILTGRWY